MEAENLAKEINQYVERVVDAFSNLISHEQYPQIPTPEQENFVQTLTESMHAIFKRMDAGIHTLLSLIVDLAKEENSSLSRERIDQLGQLIAVATVIKQHLGHFTHDMAEGKHLKEIFGINSETMQFLYDGAKYLFDHQHYFEASSTFAILTLLDPSMHLLWMGLGTSEYLQGRFEAALLAYAMAAQTDSSDSLPHIYSAHCHLSLKSPDRAIQCLEIGALVADANYDDKTKQKIVNQIHEIKRGTK